jgi:predicted PurR-regulated permease PerM
MNLPPHNGTDAHIVDIALRLGLVFLILGWCLMILAPFISIILWSGIVAVACHPVYTKLADKAGGSRRIAVALISVAGIVIIALPVILLSGSMIDGASAVGARFEAGNIVIPPPTDAVKDWPLVGGWANTLWLQASNDLSALLATYASQLTGLSKALLTFAAGVGLGMAQFLIAVAIAPILLLNSEAIGEILTRLAQRLSGEHGEEMLQLSEKTIRSVAIGVIGIAFIQAFFAGIGMLIANVPAAGLLAMIILILGIAQLSPQFVLVPVVIYLFSGDNTGMAMFFLIWSIIIAASDFALKPLLLGRGVNIPLLVILIGALGGMLMSGIVGLFTGAVVLAVGFKLLQAWIGMEEEESPASPDAENRGETPLPRS